MTMKPAFISLKVNQIVSSDESNYQIISLGDKGDLVGRDLITGKLRVLEVEKVSSPVMAAGEVFKADIDLALYTNEQREEAGKRLEQIKPMLAKSSGETVKTAAKNAKRHRSTLYRRVEVYKKTGKATSLLGKKRGRKVGVKMLGEEREEIIDNAIVRIYRTKQRNSAQTVVEEVERLCKLADLAVPSQVSIRRRIKALSAPEVMRDRGHEDTARALYNPIIDHFPGADRPLSVVQIDHTKADVICVDSKERLATGRPYLTIAIDIYSRMIVGFHLSWDPPSSVTVALVMGQAMCPKGNYLKQLGIDDAEWKVWGPMSTLHTDNGKEFVGEVLSMACCQYGIDLIHRPVKIPHLGGHIERIIKTLNRETHKLPGTTFSNTKERKGYDSDAKAVLTLGELEKILVTWIVKVYHKRIHGSLNCMPEEQFRIGCFGSPSQPGFGMPPIPADPRRIELDCMPFYRRSVQKYGIKIDDLEYYHRILGVCLTEPGKQYIIRRDPRDVSRAYFFDDKTNEYVTLPCRGIGMSAMTKNEWDVIRKKEKKAGKRSFDANAVQRGKDDMRQQTSNAVASTKSIRMRRSRAEMHAKVQKTSSVVSNSENTQDKAVGVVSKKEIKKLFSEEIVPFDIS